MAYSFDGVNQYISSSSSPVTGAMPITAFCIVKRSAVSTNDSLISLSKSGGGGALVMYFQGSSNSIFLYNEGSSSVNWQATSANTSTEWQSLTALWKSSSARQVYVNSVASSENTQNIGAVSLNRIGVGADFEGTSPLTGFLAEVAIWTAELTVDEVNSLSKGFKPNRVRPQSLVFYAPLLRNLQDMRDNLALTNNNTATVSDHPRVY